MQVAKPHLCECRRMTGEMNEFMQNENHKAPKLRFFFLFVLAIGISLLFLQMIADFVLALVMAAILATLAHPVYRRRVHWLRNRESGAAALTVFLTIAIVIVPIFVFLVVFLNEAIQVSGSLEPWISKHGPTADNMGKAIDKDPILPEEAVSKPWKRAKSCHDSIVGSEYVEQHSVLSISYIRHNSC